MSNTSPAPLPRPDPEFVELSFYVADRPEEQALLDLVGALAERDARSNGRAEVHRLPESLLPFGGPTDYEQYTVPLAQLEEIGGLGAVVQCRLVAVEVAGAFAYDRSHHAIVTFLRIQDQLVGVDNHPVAVWASGGALFSGPVRPPKARAAGVEITATFRELTTRLRPAYAAIMSTFSLLPPLEIAQNPNEIAYFLGNFFLAADYVGERELEHVEAAAQGLRTERSELGLFVFMPEFGVRSNVNHLPAGTAAAQAVARRAKAPR